MYQEKNNFSFKKEDKAKIIEKYKVGIHKGAEVACYSTFGVFST